MLFEQIADSLSVVLNLAGLMICLFRYFEFPGKARMFAVIFFLGNLLSDYYWGVYLLVMGDYPDLTSLLAYFGWNVAFVALFFMLFYQRKETGEHKFSPIAFLVIPLNVAQLILYLRFGGIFNNLWQVFWTTISAVYALDSIIFYIKNKKKSTVFPYISTVVLLFLAVEYAEWTASCFDWPSEWIDPYNYLSALSCVCYILIPLAISKECRSRKPDQDVVEDSLFTKLFKPLFIIVVLICCLGGYLLALWMRDTLSRGMQAGGANPYSIIAVTLFIVSTVIVSFTIVLIFIFNSDRRNQEQEELRTEKYLAERANSAKSDFLANMSHEIRTPINAVLGMNEMILRDALASRDELPSSREEIRDTFSEICSYSGNIDSAGKNLLSIINDILDFSKIEAGKLEIVNRDYKLSSVLNDVSNMITYKAESKGLEYRVEVDQTIPDVLRGDEVRVRQIMTNLLNNAVKYTEQGSVVLKVSAKINRDESAFICLIISVQDTGLGIKPEDRERLFKKFERMDLERNSTVEGTGLGLAITGSLVEMMSGTINVESEYGKGSVFTVTLPQAVVSHESIGDFKEKYEKSISSMKAETEHFHAPNAYILVVDDTPMNLTVVKGLLKKTQINIDTALSGAKALELARYALYDLILMDQRMPEMDGTETMKEMKKDRKGQNAFTPFICLTADAVTGSRDRYLAEGFDDYLSKPIDSHELKEILLKYLPEYKVEIVKKQPARKPELNEEQPAADKEQQPELQEQNPAAKEQQPELQEQQPAAKEQQPELQEQQPAAKEQQPELQEQQPAAQEQQPGSQEGGSGGDGRPLRERLDPKMIDYKTGLMYCASDEDFYLQVISEYVTESDTKIPSIEEYFGEKDWKNYGILVHSVKSTSKMIGAKELSGQAEALEKAAKAGDAATVEKGHESMIRLYRETVGMLRSNC